MSGRVMWIGLTGGIGSGKSTVAAWWGAQGARVVDTDAIARELTAARGQALAPIAQAFGAEFITADGELDRERMRAHVFADERARRSLEAILHPMIAQQALSQALTPGAPVVLFDVPLLAESGHGRARVDRVLVIDCPEALQIERVMARSGWTAQAVQRVIAQQATRAQRRAIADAVIVNDRSGLGALEQALQTLWHHWCAARA